MQENNVEICEVFFKHIKMRKPMNELFEDYLKDEIFCDRGYLRKEVFEEVFQDWLCGLGVAELMNYLDGFGVKFLKKEDECEKNELSVDQRRFLQAFQLRGGIATLACKDVGISVYTFYKWNKDDLKFSEQVQDIREVEIGIILEEEIEKG